MNNQLECDLCLLGKAAQPSVNKLSPFSAGERSAVSKARESLAHVAGLDFSLSALIDITWNSVVSTNNSVAVTGSELLVNCAVEIGARLDPPIKVNFELVGMGNSVPYLQIEGSRGVEQLGSGVIQSHSRYVAALFENFD